MEDTERDPDRLVLSSSSISTFTQCPKKWKHRYIDKYKEPSSYAMVLGTFVHSVLEQLMGRDPEDRTREEARVLAREEWEKLLQDDDYLGLELDDETALGFRQAAWASIRGLWDLENPQRVNVVATEEKFLLDMGDFDLVGYIDRVDEKAGRIIVTDYKTGKPPQARYQKDKLNQVILYSYAVGRTLEREVYKARLYFLGAEIVSTEITPKAIKKIESSVRDAAAEIIEAKDTQRFVPRTGPLCGWCPYIDLCPEGRSEVLKRYRAGRIRVDAPALPVALGKVEPPVRSAPEHSS